MNALPNAVALSQSAAHDLPPIFTGHVRVDDYAYRVRPGFTARLSFPDLPAASLHPFAGSATGFAFGRRLHTHLQDVAGTTLFDGDAILLWWGDDSRRGKRIDLTLDADPAVSGHPLAGCSAGFRDGDVLIAIIRDNHDVSPIPPGERALRRRLLALAHELPNDPAFREWFLTHVDGDAPPESEAIAEGLKRYCGITSRRELLEGDARAEQARGRLRGLIAEFRERYNTFE